MLVKGATRPGIPVSSLLGLAGPLYVFLNFARFYIRDPGLQIAIGALIAGLGFAFLALAMANGRANKYALLVVVSFPIFSFLSTVGGGNSTIATGMQIVSNMGYAYAVAKSDMSIRAQYGVVVALSLTFLAHAAIGREPDAIFSISRNFISVLMILAMSLYYIACGKAEKQPRMLPAILTMIVCLWAIGRSGIICAAILLIGTFAISSGKVKATIIYAGIGLAAAMIFKDQVDNIISLLSVGIERFERLSDSGPDVRAELASDYINLALSEWMYFLFGAPLAAIPSIVSVGGNPHNGYIGLHSSFGILGIIAVALLVVRGLIWSLSVRKRYIFLVFSVSLIRISFDSAAFHGQLDVAVFSCVFMAFMRNWRGSGAILAPLQAIRNVGEEKGSMLSGNTYAASMRRQ